MKYPKPSSCSGCSLESRASGFIPPGGPQDAQILIVGDSGDWYDQREGEPFSGPPGLKLASLLRKVGLDKSEVRTHNLLSCSVELKGGSSEWNALRHCRQHLEPILRAGHTVLVTLGPLASRSILSSDYKKAKINDLHGTVNWVSRPELSSGGYYVIPTYHPRFLLEGNQKLTGVSLFDLSRAKQVSEGKWSYKKAKLQIDPELSWFTRWVDRFLEAVNQGSEPWLAVDVETIEKITGGKGEDELENSQTQIVRINFSYNPDEGVTVPWVGPYIEQSIRLLTAQRCWQIYWNQSYDLPLLRQAGIRIVDNHMDAMHFAKVLQSDLPQGLGFWASFYDGMAWKHMNELNAAEYAAHDGYKTLRVALGLAKDLKQAGQWDVYKRHIYDLDRIVLKPAEEIGLLVDPERLAAFKIKLELKEAELEAKIKETVGPDAQPWVKERKTPAEGFILMEVERDVYWCSDCNQEVTEKHPRCSAKFVPKPARIKKPRKKAVLSIE